MVMVMVGVSLQEVNVSLCNAPRNDLSKLLCLCVCDCGSVLGSRTVSTADFAFSTLAAIHLKHSRI